LFADLERAADVCGLETVHVHPVSECVCVRVHAATCAEKRTKGNVFRLFSALIGTIKHTSARIDLMNATLEFDPNAYSERSLKLILLKAQEWKCTPAEAVARLLDVLATTPPPHPARKAA
jgi:hypothetical protein